MDKPGGESDEEFAEMLKAFASYIKGEAENPYSYEYEKRLHNIILKACGYKK